MAFGPKRCYNFTWLVVYLVLWIPSHTPLVHYTIFLMRCILIISETTGTSEIHTKIVLIDSDVRKCDVNGFEAEVEVGYYSIIRPIAIIWRQKIMYVRDTRLMEYKFQILLTRTNMSTFVSPIRYFPSDTRTIGNCDGHVHFSTKSRTWKANKVGNEYVKISIETIRSNSWLWIEFTRILVNVIG